MERVTMVPASMAGIPTHSNTDTQATKQHGMQTNIPEKTREMADPCSPLGHGQMELLAGRTRNPRPQRNRELLLMQPKAVLALLRNEEGNGLHPGLKHANPRPRLCLVR